ncbi:MAG: bifunctional 3,4-dihydroxy-2-butanone-4-phosphate synthase/GTP cyclohydrolase II [Parachlamydiales bacterium]|jgi:3,4-dihydroxy 2-butanone 4-phosphate synthase/GTP cyclohydrolase II
MQAVKSIELALQALKEGKLIIVADDEDRENEGDLIFSASHATPELLAFVVRHTTGIVCVPMLGERLDELQIPMMVNSNTECYRTAFTISVDYFHDTTTGVSAADRTQTIKALANPQSKPGEFRRPGHIFPLRYREGGVLKRAGHTEAAIDLCLLAKLPPVAVLCELVNDDGTMMRFPDLLKFGEKYNIPVTTVANLIKYRRKTEKLVEKVSQAKLPTPFGIFEVHAYRSALDGIEHLALVMGDVSKSESPLVRVHSECLTGDVFGSLRCDCGTQLQQAMEMIALNGEGAIIYLRGHEGRGIGLAHKVSAYNLQDQGRDTVEANLELGFQNDSREYGIGAQILADLGVTKLRLITNNPKKYGGIEGYDLEITERVSLPPFMTTENRGYLLTKKNKLGHLLEI